MPYLLPALIQHYSTTHRNSSFVLHKSVEGLFVIMTPLMKQWTSVEKHLRELLQWQRGKFWVLLADEIFIEPVTGKNFEQSSLRGVIDIRLFDLEAYPLKR